MWGGGECTFKYYWLKNGSCMGQGETGSVVSERDGAMLAVHQGIKNKKTCTDASKNDLGVFYLETLRQRW